MTKGMNFNEALEEMKKGKRVRRTLFNENFYLDKESLEDIHADMTYLDWDDLIAEDWEIVNE